MAKKNEPRRNQTTNQQTTNQKRTANQGEVAVPVIEEELQVGKRAVEKGGVRVQSRVTEKPVEETVRLREEQVNVERRPVYRKVTDADVAALKGGTMEVTTMGEEVVVDKRARVVEEVVVGKDVTEHTETVRDTVRRTDVEVEDLTKGKTRGKAGRATSGSFFAPTAEDYKKLPRDLALLRDLDEYEIADGESDPRGWTLYGRDGDEIGTIEKLLASPSARKAFFAIVDTGGWFSSKQFVLPLDAIRFDRENERANAPFIKEL
ncbi:MAG: DUF2382 domain-containing protein [Acidobacteriota bacterium]|nr:DUF2382 domain-containing protein [Acidobacteriota bacterium]